MLSTVAKTIIAGLLVLVQPVLGGPLLTRADTPFTDRDLFASCPGGPGSTLLERADRCFLLNPVQQPDQRYWFILGSPQLNCGGGTEPIKWTIGGSSTASTTTTVGGDVGFNIGGLSIGLSASSTDTQSVTASQSVEVTINPGKQAVHVAGVNYHVYSGRVEVNYPDRQYDHYIWYTNAIVTKSIPVNGDVQYDTHFSDCGTDPTHLNK